MAIKSHQRTPYLKVDTVLHGSRERWEENDLTSGGQPNGIKLMSLPQYQCRDTFYASALKLATETWTPVCLNEARRWQYLTGPLLHSPPSRVFSQFTIKNIPIQASPSVLYRVHTTREQACNHTPFYILGEHLGGKLPRVRAQKDRSEKLMS